MDERAVLRQVYGGVLTLWVLVGLWQLLMSRYIRFVLSAPEQVFWYLFFAGLPLVLVFGVHYRRRWAGWLGMVYGLLLILGSLRLIFVVVREQRLPDLSLILLFPIVITGGHLFSYSKVLFEWWWQSVNTDVAA